MDKAYAGLIHDLVFVATQLGACPGLDWLEARFNLILAQEAADDRQQHTEAQVMLLNLPILLETD